MAFRLVSTASQRKDIGRRPADERRRVLQSVVNFRTIYCSSATGCRGGQQECPGSVADAERSFGGYHGRQQEHHRRFD